MIFKIMKYNGVHKKVSFYIESEKCKLWCKTDNTGMIDVNIECNVILPISEVTKIVFDNVNHY